jgi:TetR/AcrR family transcriptional regulator, transcriptional repressor for nem operon
MARPRKFAEGDVVAAARDEFWRRGYAATSVDDLTAATGLGKGSLYGAFGDKHGLYLRALDDYIAESLDEVRAQLRDPAFNAYDRLTRHLRAQVKAIAADKSKRGCMMAKSAAELAGFDDAVEKKVERAYASWRDELVACVKEAQRDGDIDATQNPQALAGVLLAFMRGQEALHKGGAKPAQLKAAAEQMVSLIPTA